MRKKFNYLWLFLLAIIGLGLWLNSKSNLQMFFYSPWMFVAQAFGILAITFLSLNFVFTTRLRIIEKMFGGLDQVYKFHRIVGICGFSFAVAHPAFFMVHSISYPILFKYYLLPGAVWPLNYARIAFCLFVLLIVLTSIKRIPYHIWKFTHQFMGLAFLFAALHVLTIKSDVKDNFMLRSWMIGLMSLGVISFIYTKLLYRFLGSKHS